MKTSFITTALLIGGLVIAYLLYTSGIFDLHSNQSLQSDAVNIANKTASKYDIFPYAIQWEIYVSGNGKIQSIDGNGKIDKNLYFSCMFTITPNDRKDHFAWLLVFKNNSTGYVVVLDEHTGSVIFSAPVSLESVVCGP